jgi:hypothetical protein
MRASRKKAQVGDVDKGKGYGDPETCGTQSFLARRVLVERDGKAV